MSLRTFIKYFIGIIFLFSALAKILDYNQTAELLSSLFDISISLSKTLLIVLIILEFVIAYLITMDQVKYKYISLGIGLVIVAFIFANVYLLIEGYKNCGCFGTRITSSPLFSLAKNLLLGLSVYYLYKSGLFGDVEVKNKNGK